jgi:predicted PurR-regulated permease PerM
MPPALSVSNTDSLGEQIQRRFPEAKVVKTLHTMNAYLMVDPTQLAGADHTVFVSAAGFVAALATILTLTFFLILGSERYLNAGVELFAEQHRPLVRRLLTKSAGAVTGYVTGNLAISVICGVTTFVVALVLGMPYAAALALLVGVLDLIPLVGATLGGALLVIVGLFVELWKAVVLLVYIVVYQQVEGSILQPIVYSHAVQLNALVIFIAVLVGGFYWASRGHCWSSRWPRSSGSSLPTYWLTGASDSKQTIPPSRPRHSPYLNTSPLSSCVAARDRRAKRKQFIIHPSA